MNMPSTGSQLSPTGQRVMPSTFGTDAELTIGRLNLQVERQRRALELKDEAISLLRDSLAEAESELDALRQIIAAQKVTA